MYLHSHSRDLVSQMRVVRVHDLPGVVLLFEIPSVAGPHVHVFGPLEPVLPLREKLGFLHGENIGIGLFQNPDQGSQLHQKNVKNNCCGKLYTHFITTVFDQSEGGLHAGCYGT